MIGKRIKQLLLLSLMVFCTACSSKQDNGLLEPELGKMRSICELATMDCYFNNVAKYKGESEGMLWWEKEKQFWIEYSGIVKLGIDVSLVDLKVKDDCVTITIPKGKVLECKVDDATLSEESFIFSEDAADISAEEQILAFKEAQSNMEQVASEDDTLLNYAQQRAQILLEDYVTNIGEVVGKQYRLEWVYVDNEEDVANQN